ncbi:MAG: corrinoid protein-associated methyltransferase CpaM [Candidatus Binatia bacterium]
MSTYVYMRILESAPRRYDWGLRLLSLGRITAVYDAVAAAAVGTDVAPRVLEIGCGTGNLTAALLARGATVTAIDQNPDMLAVAEEKLGTGDGRLTLREMAAVEIADRFPPAAFDAVAASLVLSEMSEEEQQYVLEAARRLLCPGGRLAVADEVQPPGLLARLRYACVRWPLAALTYVLTQTSTSAVRDLAPRVRAAGFRVVAERLPQGGMTLVIGEKPAEAQ